MANAEAELALRHQGVSLTSPTVRSFTLLALRVGQHGPGPVHSPAEVHTLRTEGEDLFTFGLPISGTRGGTRVATEMHGSSPNWRWSPACSRCRRRRARRPMTSSVHVGQDRPDQDLRPASGQASSNTRTVGCIGRSDSRFVPYAAPAADRERDVRLPRVETRDLTSTQTSGKCRRRTRRSLRHDARVCASSICGCEARRLRPKCRSWRHGERRDVRLRVPDNRARGQASSVDVDVTSQGPAREPDPLASVVGCRLLRAARGGSGGARRRRRVVVRDVPRHDGGVDINVTVGERLESAARPSATGKESRRGSVPAG